MIKLKRERLHPMSLSICYWLPQLSTCHFIKCCAVFVFFTPQVFWPASTSKIEECQMAGKDPTVRKPSSFQVKPIDSIKYYK